MRPEHKKFSNIKEFYPYYLSQHRDPVCRALHFSGTALVFAVLLTALVFGNYLLLVLIPLVGYGFAWVGHAFFEKNKPATFTYPFYSLGSDFIMFWDILAGSISKKMEEADLLYPEES